MIKTWCWRPDFLNFGEELGPVIVAKLAKQKTKWVEPQDAQIISIGAILDWSPAEIPLKPGTIVWGGSCCNGGGKVPDRGLNIVHTRGPLSAKRLGLKDVPFGDVGLLGAPLLGIKRKPSKTVGLIIGHVDDRLFKDDQWKDVKLIRVKDNINNDPEAHVRKVCEQIAECGVIISSSLHGLVVADSLGIPTTRYVLRRPGGGPKFRFDDYYMGIGEEPLPALSLKEAFNAKPRRTDPDKVYAAQKRALGSFVCP